MNLSSLPPPFTPPPPACPTCPICASCQCSCPACNNTVTTIFQPYNITPYNLTCPPPDLHGYSCVPWQTPQKLAVGIVGGVLAGILVSVLLSYSLIRKSYKLKKISEFMKEDLDKP
jgi:hypothetical protein